MKSLAQQFHDTVQNYRNTGEINDRVFADFTAAANADAWLSAHRAHVEANQLGFGDRAFHALWKLLLAAAVERFEKVRALEIGVFKGQVVSLWALLARQYGWTVHIHGITPFQGQPLPSAGWWRSLQARFNPRFRARIKSGDFYPEDDYEEIVRRHFSHHNLAFDDVTWLRGYSVDHPILERLQDAQFEIVYIDGGHTYEAAVADIQNFAPKLRRGGWLVMDDAAYDLPGTSFWKGYESVTNACRLLAPLGFVNCLNVGHNRVFERV